MIRFCPGEAEAGERIDVVLAARASVTRTLAQRALRDGHVLVNGKAARPSHRLEPGDEVAGRVPPPVFAEPQAEDIPVTVRYSDEDVLVVSKPPGVVTHPASGHESGTLVNALLALGEPLASAGSTRPGIVHRLDKDTSGLLLVAKSDESHARLVEALRDRRIERRYLALVRGRPEAEAGTVDAPIGRHPRKRTHMAVVPDGRPSVTHHTTIGRIDKATLLDVRLETGRTHQIRVHMAHVGHPVIGDRTYGGYSEQAAAAGLSRPFLHAYRLSFPAAGGEETTVLDPLPDDLADVAATLGLEVPDIHTL